MRSVKRIVLVLVVIAQLCIVGKSSSAVERKNFAFVKNDENKDEALSPVIHKNVGRLTIAKALKKIKDNYKRYDNDIEPSYRGSGMTLKNFIVTDQDFKTKDGMGYVYREEKSVEEYDEIMKAYKKAKGDIITPTNKDLYRIIPVIENNERYLRPVKYTLDYPDDPKNDIPNSVILTLTLTYMGGESTRSASGLDGPTGFKITPVDILGKKINWEKRGSKFVKGPRAKVLHLLPGLYEIEAGVLVYVINPKGKIKRHFHKIKGSETIRIAVVFPEILKPDAEFPLFGIGEIPGEKQDETESSTFNENYYSNGYKESLSRSKTKNYYANSKGDIALGFSFFGPNPIRNAVNLNLEETYISVFYYMHQNDHLGIGFAKKWESVRLHIPVVKKFQRIIPPFGYAEKIKKIDLNTRYILVINERLFNIKLPIEDWMAKEIKEKKRKFYDVKWKASIQIAFKLSLFGKPFTRQKKATVYDLEPGDKTNLGDLTKKEIEITLFAKGPIFWFYDWRSMVFEMGKDDKIADYLKPVKDYGVKEKNLFQLTNQKYNFKIHNPKCSYKTTLKEGEGRLYKSKSPRGKFKKYVSVFCDCDFGVDYVVYKYKKYDIYSYAADDSKFDIGFAEHFYFYSEDWWGKFESEWLVPYDLCKKEFISKKYSDSDRFLAVSTATDYLSKFIVFKKRKLIPYNEYTDSYFDDYISDYSIGVDFFICSGKKKKIGEEWLDKILVVKPKNKIYKFGVYDVTLAAGEEHPASTSLRGSYSYMENKKWKWKKCDFTIHFRSKNAENLSKEGLKFTANPTFMKVGPLIEYEVTDENEKKINVGISAGPFSLSYHATVKTKPKQLTTAFAKQLYTVNGSAGKGVEKTINSFDKGNLKVGDSKTGSFNKTSWSLVVDNHYEYFINLSLFTKLKVNRDAEEAIDGVLLLKRLRHPYFEIKWD